MQYGRLFSPMLTYTATTVFRLSDRNLAVQCLVCGILFGQCHLPGIERLTIAVLTIVLLFHRTPEYRQIVNQINEIWNKLCRRSA